MSREPDHKQFNTSDAQKTRKPPKPGPHRRRAEDPHRIPLNVGLLATDKMKFLRVIARDSRLTDAQKAVAIPLVDNVNSEKGHSFISWDELGRESGLGWQTAKRAVDRLEALKYVNVDHIEGEVVHVSLNLDKISAPKPERKRTVSREEAREKAAAKKAGKVDQEMSSQTYPVQRQELPEAMPSQRQLVPVGMYGQTSPGMYDEASPAMSSQTSGEMYGETSKSENRLREVIQREEVREGYNDAAGASPVRAPIASRLGQEEVPADLDAEKPAGKLRGWISPTEMEEAYDRVLQAWRGTSHPIGKRPNHKGASAEIMRKGWTVDQVITRIQGGQWPMDMNIIRFFGIEFDVGEKHTKSLARQERREVRSDILRKAGPARSWDAGLDEDDEDERQERRQEQQASRPARRFPSRVAEEHAPF